MFQLVFSETVKLNDYANAGFDIKKNPYVFSDKSTTYLPCKIKFDGVGTTQQQKAMEHEVAIKLYCVQSKVSIEILKAKKTKADNAQNQPLIKIGGDGLATFSSFENAFKKDSKELSETRFAITDGTHRFITALLREETRIDVKLLGAFKTLSWGEMKYVHQFT